MGLWDKTVGKVADVVGKGVEKIPSDNDRMQQANEVLANTKEVDLEQIKLQYVPRNNFNVKNVRHWIELVCFLGFSYSYFLAPVINDIFNTSLQGAGRETQELLYAMLGLGGYRLAEKFKGGK